MSSVVLITGASTGIGNLAARELATHGHTVYASMRNTDTGNSEHADELIAFGRTVGGELHVVELDVQSQASADAAVTAILEREGRLDTVVHNAGHLFLGYVEAFTAEDVQHLFDINVIGIQRVNRAALPHMRSRRSGTLLYVGSTTSAVLPPFIGPYVASKAAGDALAQVTAYEVNEFGIETTIVIPGPFIEGTSHFPNASQAGDTDRAESYAVFAPLLARYEEASNGLFPVGTHAHPGAVAQEIARILDLPAGTRPFRSLVDFSNSGAEAVHAAGRRASEEYTRRMGYEDLLHVKIQTNTTTQP
ncbi:SDR family NAD(P)-dependent oxidoreductase [Streptomyces graminifolii]|uniref:SDR family NAD(P)-dependent oxidoreductase n=1 Tax=Streptomyces graminifolii TaxID=1266771 RepID=UPI00405946D2